MKWFDIKYDKDDNDDDGDDDDTIIWHTDI